MASIALYLSIIILKENNMDKTEYIERFIQRLSKEANKFISGPAIGKSELNYLITVAGVLMKDELECLEKDIAIRDSDLKYDSKN